jgi:hypothetical protein
MITYLLIPFEAKDELKKLYNIKWDTEKKLWFIGELVDGLKPYTIKDIFVKYEDKDEYKANLPSMKWDATRKRWTCSLKDYEKYLKLTE